MLGVKWRFFQQSKEGGWNISIYPQVEFNNPDSAYDRGLVDRGPRLLLPVEITKVFGPIEVNLEVGYWFAKDRQHERIVGLAFGHQFTRKFEGLAEIYDAVLLGGRERSTSIDIGGRYEFHKDLLLIFMAGRSPLRSPWQSFGQPTYVGYFGLQVQINHKKQPKAPNRNPK